MRCLYCGKELALLKRLRGGGEFCSDAHRQQYQEEYNQLALDRLLQAMPPEDPTKPAASLDALKSATSPTSPRQEGPSGDERPRISQPAHQPASRQTAELWQGGAIILDAPPGAVPPAAELPFRAKAPLGENATTDGIQTIHSSPAFVPSAPDVEAPAAAAGFLVEAPYPSEPSPFTSRVELVALETLRPALPSDGQHLPQDLGCLQGAGRVSVGAARAVDSRLRPRSRMVEPRDFSRPVRASGVLLAGTEHSSLARVQDPMEIVMSPCAPPTAAASWMAPECTFDTQEMELGDLARLQFGTVGFVEESRESAPAVNRPTAPAYVNFAAAAPAPVAEPVSAPVTAPAAAPVQIAQPTLDAAPTPVPVPVDEQAVLAEMIPADVSSVDVEKADSTAEVSPVDVTPVDVTPNDVTAPEVTPVEAKAAEITPVKAEPEAPPIPEAIAAATIPEPVSAPVADPNLAPAGRATQMLPVTVPALAAAGRGRVAQVFAAPVLVTADIQIPHTGATPLRPMMFLEAAVATPEPVVETKKETEAIRPGSRDILAKLAQRNAEPDKSVAGQRVAPKPQTERSQPEKLKIQQRPRNEAERKVKSQETKSETAPEVKAETKPDAKSEITKPETKPEIKTETKAPLIAAKVVEPVPAKKEAPDTSASKNDSSRAGMKERDFPKPVSAPTTDLDLGLPVLHLDSQQGFFGRLPIVGKIALAVVVLAAIGGAIYMATGGHMEATPSAASREAMQPGPPITDATWVTDWSPEAAKRGRHLSLFKNSLPLNDYRMLFDAQIESKSIGWIYRAVDTQNFYVAKIEVVKPGLEPVVALVHFAVVKGQDQPREQAMIPIKVRLDTVYKVRFEAVGEKFTTWIGEKKVGEWTDDKFRSGPPGLFNDKGESAVMNGVVNVIPLVSRK